MEISAESSTPNHKERQSKTRRKEATRVFWLLVHLSITSVLLVILRLIEVDFILESAIRIIPGRGRYILWPVKKLLGLGSVQNCLRNACKDVEKLNTMLEARRVFCIACASLILTDIALGLFIRSIINSLRMNPKATDFKRIAMVAVRICILAVLLKNKHGKEMANLLGPEDVAGLIVAQYCFSSAWNLVKDIEESTGEEILTRIMGYWAINTAISKEKPSVVEMLVNSVVRRFEKDIDSISGITSIIIRPSSIIEYILTVIITPFFSIVIVLYLSGWARMFKHLVRKEFHISNRTAYKYAIAVSVVLALFFIYRAYCELWNVTNALGTRGNIEAPLKKEPFNGLLAKDVSEIDWQPIKDFNPHIQSTNNN
ncbi:hypothetical protein M970_031250 [Encephalitozoon cuniculi EcunIII-L]|nr:hypothetical protein M970_031250 [Encephalitozoon cuniculi EcunIII-L]